MKKILVYTYFDEESKHAVNYGVEMALKENLSVEILHVINTAHYGPDFMATGDGFTGGDYISSAIKENTIISVNKFKELTDEIKRKYSELPEIHTMLKTGIDSRAVIEETSKKDTMMLLFPGYGKSELFDFITDIRPVVISQAKCPVLLLPEGVTFSPFKTIVYLTDFDQEDTDAFIRLAEIARPFNTTIVGLHITNNNDFTEKIKEEGFINFIKEKSAYNHIELHSVGNNNVEQSILNFASEKKADLIALLRENKNFLERIFVKSISKSIAKDSKLPVIIFNKH